MVEQLFRKQQVAGSSPVVGSRLLVTNSLAPEYPIGWGVGVFAGQAGWRRRGGVWGHWDVVMGAASQKERQHIHDRDGEELSIDHWASKR